MVATLRLAPVVKARVARVASAERAGTASQWEHGWLAQATLLPMKPVPYASCQSPVSPLAAYCKLFSLALRVTQHFLVPTWKVNGFAAILLFGSSQLPFLRSQVPSIVKFCHFLNVQGLRSKHLTRGSRDFHHGL